MARIHVRAERAGDVMGATDRYDTDAIANETAWQDTERIREAAADRVASELRETPTPAPHAPTPAELEELFRPAPAPAPVRERDRRILALTHALRQTRHETVLAQRAARVLTRYAKVDPRYADAAHDARVRALAFVRYRDTLHQQLLTLTGGDEQENTL